MTPHYALNRQSVQRLKALIIAGQYDTAAWSFTADDSNSLLGDGNWTEYAQWFLGEDKSLPYGKDRYAYPFGKGATASAAALKLAARAPEPDIAQAAKECLAMIEAATADRTKASATPCELLALSGPLSITAAAACAGGRVRRFTMVAYTGSEMRLQGFQHAVVVDLAGMSGTGGTRPIFLGHSPDKIIGHADSIMNDGRCLTASGAISGTGDAAREVLQTHDNGFPWQASIGARPDAMEFLADGQTANVNGRSVQGPLNIARKSTLGEISFVPLGADDSTSARIAAQHRRSQMDPITTTDTTVTVIDEVQAERQRIASIMKASGKFADRVPAAKFATIQASAVSEGWNADKTELELIRAARPDFPCTTSAYDGPSVPQVIEASFALTCGLSEKIAAKHYDQRTLDAAQSAGARGVTLHGLIRNQIRAGGGYAPDRIDNQAIRAAFESEMKIKAGGFSTMSLTSVLANVQNKFLMQAYEGVATTWQTWCAQGDVKDFKPTLRIRLVGSGQFETVPNSGQIKAMSLTDQGYTNQAATEGAIVTITRQNLINDDTAALNQTPSVLGRAAAVAVEEAIYGLLLANTGSLFGAGNKNYQSGAGTALSIASLTTAEQLMLEQVDDNGKPILIRPSVLLVPPALKATAENLFNGANLVVTALGLPASTSGSASAQSATTAPSSNPFVSRYFPQVSPWLGTKAGLAGASDVAWFLMATPAGGVSPLEAVFLNGQRAPIIENSVAEFDTLGIQSRAYLDFGVAQQDPRGGVKSAGV